MSHPPSSSSWSLLHRWGCGLAWALLATGLVAAPALSPSRAEREALAKDSVAALRQIERNHFSGTELRDLENAEALAAFIDTLDPLRLYFTEADLQLLRLRFGGTYLSSYLLKGNFFPAIETYRVFVDLVRARQQWLQTRLSQPVATERDDTYVVDRENLPFAPDAAALDLVWEQRLTDEVIGELLAGGDLATAQARVLRRADRLAETLSTLELPELQEMTLSAIGGLLDPHTSFFSAESLEDFETEMSNTLVGIGVQLRDEDGYPTVQQVVPGGPAERSRQIFPGDRVLSVRSPVTAEEVDVVGLPMRRVIRLLRGEPGSSLRLTVAPARGTEEARRQVTLERAEITLTANLAEGRLFEAPLGPGGTIVPLGVIHLPAFYGPTDDASRTGGTTRDVAELIRGLRALGMQALVLDLRDNSGGLLSEAVDLAGLFLRRAPIVQVGDGSGRLRVDWDRSAGIAWEGPLVVLTSKSSASASEIVAGALRDHDRAIVVGHSSTHGKGTVQAIMGLRDNPLKGFFANPNAADDGAVRVTVQKFYLPGGSSTQSLGVPSDIALETPDALWSEGESELPRALEWGEVLPAQWTEAETRRPGLAVLTNELRESLIARSEARQRALPEFAWLADLTAYWAEQRDLIELPLSLAARQQRRAENEARVAALEALRSTVNAAEAWPQQPVLVAAAVAQEAEHQTALAAQTLPDGRPRAGAYYQRVYYHPEPSGKLREVFAEEVPYHRLRAHAPRLAEIATTALGWPVEATAMDRLLVRLEDQRGEASFDPETLWRDELGLPPTAVARLGQALPAFFATALAADPALADPARDLDVPLRESFRVLADWLAMLPPANVQHAGGTAAVP